MTGRLWAEDVTRMREAGVNRATIGVSAWTGPTPVDAGGVVVLREEGAQ